MDSAVTISNGALMLFTGIVAGLTGCIAVLFRSLLAAKDQQIADGKEREAKLLRITETQASTGQRFANVAERVGGP